MNIEYTINTVFEVMDMDIETLVHDNYPFLSDYIFATVEQCNNNSYHRFDVDGEFSEEDTMDLHEIEVNFIVPMGKNNVLLNMLCRDELIEPGIYLINAWIDHSMMS